MCIMEYHNDPYYARFFHDFYKLNYIELDQNSESNLMLYAEDTDIKQPLETVILLVDIKKRWKKQQVG